MEISFGIILVSEEQQIKLLELKRKYFYKGIYYLEKHALSNTLFVGRREDDGDVRVHWFEFCLTHLAHRVYHLSPPVEAVKMIIDAMAQGIHPIDKLYKDSI